jgi:hypothetical protein
MEQAKPRLLMPGLRAFYEWAEPFRGCSSASPQASCSFRTDGPSS